MKTIFIKHSVEEGDLPKEEGWYITFCNNNNYGSEERLFKDGAFFYQVTHWLEEVNVDDVIPSDIEIKAMYNTSPDDHIHPDRFRLEGFKQAITLIKQKLGL